MATQRTIAEIRTNFNFDEWIIKHKLNDIKDKLIEHGLIQTDAISTTSNEFKSKKNIFFLCRDCNQDSCLTI